MAGPPHPDRAVLVDALIAAAFAVLSVLLVAGVVESGGDRAVSSAVALAHVAPLAVRRRWPLGVLAAMAATALLTVPTGTPLVVLGPAVLVGVYTVGARCSPARSRAALALTLAVMAVVVVANGMTEATLVSNGVALTVTWWLGDRARRAVLDTERERAAAAEATRRGAAAERLRIARELHDVVAHAMSVIAVQAGTGRFVIDEAPDTAREALATIETTSRTALQEMRRLLAVLRDDDGLDNELSPAPTIRELDELIAATSSAGVEVSVERVGDVVELPSGVELCAYRVIQEALTNVRKHADASRAVVTIAYQPAALRVEVVDDGRGNVSARGGQGHLGMRERVALYGGTLEVGPRHGGGYRVAAELPLAAQS